MAAAARSAVRRPAFIPDRAAQGGVRRHRPDYVLPLLMVALIVVGIIVVFSISPALSVEKGADGSRYIMRQFIAAGLGLAVFVAAASVPLNRWRTLYKPLLILAGMLTVLTLVLPVNAQYPAHRWIRFGGFSFQSVELVKFAGIMWLSAFLVRQKEQGKLADMKQTVRPLAMIIVGLALVVAGLQSDLGSFVVIAGVMFMVAFVAGFPMQKILLGLVVLGLLGTILISVMPYRRERLTAFMHPDCSSRSGYQTCQAMIAVGSGGMIGLGLGNSVQAYGYLPEAENDSIFAVYAEKFGFVGSVILLGLFAALFTRIKKVAERAPDMFTRLIVMAFLTWLLIQTTMNIGAMIGLLPLKGITLPLVSYGGSSILMVMAALGVIFQASRYTGIGNDLTEDNGKAGFHGYSDDRRGVRGTYHSATLRRP